MQVGSGSELSRAPIVAAIAGILAATAVAHGGALRADFVAFDDDTYVYENPQVQAGLSASSIAWAFRIDERKTYFHPLTWVSLMADRTLFGPEPLGFHATNLALHGLNAVLLFLLLLRTTGRPWPSLAATLLFCVHPLTVEAVAWITERKTVLSTALGLLSVHAFVSHAARPSRWRIATSTALLGAALLAKPGLVVLPVLLLVLDFWPLRRLGRRGEGLPGWGPALPMRAVILEKAPLAAVSGIVLVLALVSAETTAHAEAEAASAWLRVANAIVSIPRYVAVSVWPTDLSVFHLFPERVPLLAVLGGALFVAVATAGAWLAAGRWPWLTAGWAWFVVALLPYLGLKQAGLWPAWADRFMYVPLMGLAVALTFSVARAVSTRPRAAVGAGVAIAVAVAALTGAAREQGRHWTDSIALFQRGAALEPGSYLMNLGLGGALVRAHRVAEAEAPFRAAVSIYPTSARAQALLGSVLASTERPREAEARYREALRLDPRDEFALLAYAELLRRSGLVEQARPLYQAIVDRSPPVSAPVRERALRALGR